MVEPHIILKTQFGIENPEIQQLDGELNANYLVQKGSRKWILKAYHPDVSNPGILEAENQVLLHLAKSGSQAFPCPQKNNSGKRITRLENTYLKLLSYVPGDLMKDSPQPMSLASSLGGFLAEMDLELETLNIPSLKYRESPWDLNHFLENETLLPYITDPEKRKTVHYVFMKYTEEVWPVRTQLPLSIIHSDANDWNILVKDGQVTGLIDFGDMVFSQRINETAIALAYLLFDKEDPLCWAEAFIAQYHSVLPYQLSELEILYYLVAARLSITLCRSSYWLAREPEHSYMQVSAESAWQLLEQWITINPLEARNRFRKAAGFPIKQSSSLKTELKKRHRYISQALSVSYDHPILMTGAAFQYMYDRDGRTYLDAQNNIPHVGHTHPAVVEAGQRQMSRLNTNTRYIYPELGVYAERLVQTFPQPLSKVFFVNSGSAATDLALRLAFNHTGCDRVMILEHGYHGNTRLGIDVSHYKFGGRGGKGQSAHVLKVPLPDTYRGPFTLNDGRAGRQYAKQAEDILAESGKPVAAFLAEPVVGCGGQVPLAKGYLKDVYGFIRKQGGVCISDEVQVGFGRLGEWFWGFESHQVIPDIVILGKPMGNGHPIGAVITTDEMASSFENGMEFFSSFGGNPVSCAIGLAVLDVIEQEQLQPHAFDTGSFLMSLFKDLQQHSPFIGDVRGSGLFIGIEMVKDLQSKEPHTELAQYIKNELRDRGILIGTDGPFDHVLKIKPPMCFNKLNAQMLVENTQHILKKFHPAN